jgi:hypothetical protein
MKTAMQELYDLLESYRLLTDNISIVDVQRMVGIYYNGKEKEQIINSAKEGCNWQYCKFKNAEDYYEQTYNT